MRAHPTDDGIHEDIELVHAVEGRGDDAGQRKHEADGDETALSSRQRLHVFGGLASHPDLQFHQLLRVVQLDGTQEPLPLQVPAAMMVSQRGTFNSSAPGASVLPNE